MIERWFTGRRAMGLPTTLSALWRSLADATPVYVEVGDTGPADTPLAIRHGLGSVPTGLRLVNQATGSAAGPVAWYREAGDPAWGSMELIVRFDVANAKVLLEVLP